MKLKLFSIFFIFSYLCFFITPSFSASKVVGNAATWRSSINRKSQQITISGQENKFIINLFLSAKKQPLLQILYSTETSIPQAITSLNFTLGNQIFSLRKQITNAQNQIYFDTILTTQQLQIFIQDFSTKEKAYITLNHEVTPLSLKGSASIISTLLQYLSKHPIPELRVFFNKINTSNPTVWFNISLQQNQLLYGMSFIVFLLLCRRPIFKFIAYIYKKRRNNYRTNKALKIALIQIEQNANILYIKRDQLLFKDEYGSLIEDKWIQEIYRFIRTKIKPLLAEQHLLEFYPLIQKDVVKKITNIAKYPPKSENAFFKKLKKERLQYSPTMDPFDYEAYCAELLRKKGWNAEVTTASGDQGADVIAVKRGITLIIQCKLYSKPVGNKAVQEVNAAKIFYHAHYAAVVSNAAYTTSARQLAGSTKVALLHHETLQKFAQTLR